MLDEWASKDRAATARPHGGYRFPAMARVAAKEA